MACLALFFAPQLGKLLHMPAPKPLIGHPSVVEAMAATIEGGHGAHAFLLVGPSGVGKSEAAELLAARLVCAGQERPCGECTACLQFTAGVHPDVSRVQRQTDERTGKVRRQLSVEQIRELINQLSRTSAYGRSRVAMITDAEAMVDGASNALLKTLEEPAAGVVFLLTARHPSRLPATVVSRCQVVHLHPLPTVQLAALLAVQGLPMAEATRLATWSGGLPGLAARLAHDPDAQVARRESATVLLELLASTPAQRLARIGELAAKVQAADDEAASSRLDRWVGEWVVVVRDLLLVTLGHRGRVRTEFALDQLQRLSAAYAPRQVVELANQLERAHAYLAANANLRLVLEHLMLASAPAAA